MRTKAQFEDPMFNPADDGYHYERWCNLRGLDPDEAGTEEAYLRYHADERPLDAMHYEAWAFMGGLDPDDSATLRAYLGVEEKG